jgi:hypothetical protein
MSFALINRIRLLNYVIPTISALFLFGCQVGKYMKEDQYLLKQNSLEIQGKVESPRLLAWELETLYKQTPNKRLLFVVPREWFYFSTQGPEDTTSFDRWKRRALGEPPAIYSDSLAAETAEAMAYYLQYKGYFNAAAYAEDENVGRHKVKVRYVVSPGEQFVIDSVFYASADPNIEAWLKRSQWRSPLRQGTPVDLQLFDQERSRITRELRNQGYANFYDGYIDQLEVDTSGPAKHANLYIQVLPPFGDSLHQQFTIGNVSVYPDYQQPREDVPPPAYRDTFVDGVHYFFTDNRGQLELPTLQRSVFLKPNDIFRQEDYDRTNKRLCDLGVFSFVRIRQSVDSLRPEVLHFDIQLTPSQPIELGADFDINYTNRNGASGAGNLIGLSVSPSLRNRNLFGGAEQWVSNLSAGVELNTLRGAQLWNTIDLSAQTNLYIPRFNDYLGFWRGLYQIPAGKRKHLLNPAFYEALRDNATSRISASYNYLLILDWYRYNLFNANYGYDFQRNRQARYIINHIGIDYLKPILEEPFRRQLEQNPFLERSFGQQVFVSLLFRDIDYLYTSRVSRFGESHVVNLRVEAAGAEIWAANAIYNEFALKPTVFRLGDTTDFSQYLKLETDLRFYRQFSKDNSIASRINLGLARPFGFTSDVPYVKQFFVGGPNSIRAWAPRSLGPGGYEEAVEPGPRNSNRFYQTGDVRLELSAEYRFTIFWIFKGALFLDAGNVWTFERDDSRPGSQLLLRRKTYLIEGKEFVHYPFYRQMAVAGGLGLRVDLSFFIFRLDMGVRLRDPYPLLPATGLPRERDWWNSFRGFGLRDVAFNLGLGYPF